MKVKLNEIQLRTAWIVKSTLNYPSFWYSVSRRANNFDDSFLLRSSRKKRQFTAQVSFLLILYCFLWTERLKIVNMDKSGGKAGKRFKLIMVAHSAWRWLLLGMSMCVYVHLCMSVCLFVCVKCASLTQPYNLQNHGNLLLLHYPGQKAHKSAFPCEDKHKGYSKRQSHTRPETYFKTFLQLRKHIQTCEHTRQHTQYNNIVVSVPGEWKQEKKGNYSVMFLSLLLADRTYDTTCKVSLGQFSEKKF